MKTVTAPNYSYSWYPREFYSISESFMGLMIGLWIPLMKRARNNDCFSMMWTLAMDMAKWSVTLDKTDVKKFEGFWDWMFFLLTPILTSVQIW